MNADPTEPERQPINDLLEVAFLAYFFPPLGGSGVQRSLKFVRYLPEYSVAPRVITGPGIGGDRWSPLDAGLVSELPSSTCVYRVLNEAPAASRAQRLTSRWLRRRSPFSRWWVRGAIEVGRRVIREHGIRLIYASMLPYETAEAAACLASENDLPWIADLRDPWALDEMMVFPTPLHRRLELSAMESDLSSARAIIMNTREAARALCARFPALSAASIHVIPNGFDPEDFSQPLELPRDKIFRIAHTGYSYADRAAREARNPWLRWVRGARCPVDFLGRSPHYLLRALERWVESAPSIVAQVRLIWAGELSAADRSMVENSKVAGMVELPGYLTHAESIATLRRADLLFLPMQGLPTGYRARLVPAKLYEYLGVGRPILGAVPEGDAKRILRDSGRAGLCAPTDVAGMLRILKQSLAEFQECGRPPVLALDRHTRCFERRNLTQKLASVLRNSAAAGV